MTNDLISKLYTEVKKHISLGELRALKLKKIDSSVLQNFGNDDDDNDDIDDDSALNQMDLNKILTCLKDKDVLLILNKLDQCVKND